MKTARNIWRPEVRRLIEKRNARKALLRVWGLVVVAVLSLGTTVSAIAQVGSAPTTQEETTETPTPTATFTPTATPTSTATPTPTNTPTPTPIPTFAMSWNYNRDNNPLNGYFQEDRGWIPGLISESSWMIGHPQYSYGGAVWYSQYVMEGTARARGMSLDGYLDGVSLMSPSDLGKTVWIRFPDREWDGPYLVVDCAQINHHFAAAYYVGEVIELGWQTALKYEMVGAGRTIWHMPNVEVWVGVERPPDDPGTPVFYPDWWLSQVTFQ